MKLAGKTTVVTGGASGVGRALAEGFARESAGAVVVADIDEEGAHEVVSTRATRSGGGLWT